MLRLMLMFQHRRTRVDPAIYSRVREACVYKVATKLTIVKAHAAPARWSNPVQVTLRTRTRL